MLKDPRERILLVLFILCKSVRLSNKKRQCCDFRLFFRLPSKKNAFRMLLQKSFVATMPLHGTHACVRAIKGKRWQINKSDYQKTRKILTTIAQVLSKKCAYQLVTATSLFLSYSESIGWYIGRNIRFGRPRYVGGIFLIKVI